MEISERHRHRYEFNREYEEPMTAAGLRISGSTPDGTYVEMVELPDHPHFIGCQFHPEFKSKPLEPHPLFSTFIGAAYQYGLKRRAEKETPAVEMFHRPEKVRARLRATEILRIRHTDRVAEIPNWAWNLRLSVASKLSKADEHRSFQVGDIHVGSGDLFLIAGPCVIESEEHAIRMAEIIKGVARSLEFPFIFKASYDKANRTSIRSFRGPGIKEGLRILKKIKNELNVPILTDVHETADVGTVAEVADVLQIPAFLSRQTDLVVAAALSGRVVNIKKGQFVAPLGHAPRRREVPRCGKHASFPD